MEAAVGIAVPAVKCRQKQVASRRNVSGDDVKRQLALGIEQVQLLGRHAERHRLTSGEPRVDGELGDQVDLARVQMYELLVAEVLDDVDDCRDSGFLASAPVRDLEVLGADADNYFD